MAIARRLLLRMAIATALAACGCSAFEPQVGVSQESCGVDALAPRSSQGSTGYGMTGPSTPTICAEDAGSPCDDCESKWCCSTRLPCYEDPVCACLDHALDGCLDSAGNGESAIAACWASFSGSGSVEAARVACERAWCQQACAVP